MLLASLSFAVMGGFAKVVSVVLPPVEVTFFRNVFGVALVGFAIYQSPLKQIGGRPLLLFFRGAMEIFRHCIGDYFGIVGSVF